MLQFEEYKVKLNNLKPEIEGLDKALGIEQAKREVEELEIKSSQPGFWDKPGGEPEDRLPHGFAQGQGRGVWQDVHAVRRPADHLRDGDRGGRRVHARGA